MKETPGQQQTDGSTFFFSCELKLLPKITHLEDALNIGRSKGVCVLDGLQSVNQMYAIVCIHQQPRFEQVLSSVYQFNPDPRLLQLKEHLLNELAVLDVLGIAAFSYGDG